MMRAWRAAHPLKAAFAHLRSNARQRGITFALSLEEFASFCERTDYLTRKGCLETDALQVDRIDASRGYEPGNITVLTLSENAAKGNVEKFLKRAWR